MEALVDRFIDLRPWYVDDRQLSAAREELEELATRVVKIVSRMKGRAKDRSDISPRLRKLEMRKARLIHAIWILQAEERRRREWPTSQLEKWLRIQVRMARRALEGEQRRASEPGKSPEEMARVNARIRRARRNLEMYSQVLLHLREMDVRVHTLRDVVEWARTELMTPPVSPVAKLSADEVGALVDRVAQMRSLMREALTQGGTVW